MAGTIKGMTIEIGGNTAPLEQALKDTNKEIQTTQKELNAVNKALKLDPTNTELLKQKQKLLGDQIGTTTTKLDALKQAQSKLDAEIKKGGNVNQEEYRKLEREIATTETTLKKLKEEAKNTHPQLAKIEEALKKAGTVATDIAKKGFDLTVAGIQTMATACASAVTALGGLALKAGAMADDLNALSSVSGLTTKQLQEFAYASDLIDVSTETLTGSLTKLTNNMNTAKKGSGEVYDTFKKLGVEFQNSDGSLRSANDVFNEAITALGKLENETERDAMAMKLFGKSAKELNPLIEGGAEQLAEMSKQANDLGLILSQEALDGANAFNDQIDILKANGKATFQVIGTEIATQLTPAMEKVNEVTMGYIKELTTAMKDKGLEGLISKAGEIIGDITARITEGLPKIAKLGTEIVKSLVETIRDHSAQIGYAGADIITTLEESFYEILPTLIDSAIQMASAFVLGFGEQLPDLIPKVVDGLIATADAIVNNLDFIIEAGLQLFLGLVQGLEKAIPKLIAKLPEIIQKVVTTLVDSLPTIIEAIGTIIISIANTIGESAETLIPEVIKTILALVDLIIDNLPTIIDTIVTVVIAIAEALIDNIDLLIDGAIQLIVGLADGLVRAIPKLVERLPEIIMAIVNGLIALAGELIQVATKLISTLADALVNGVGGLGEALGNLWIYIKDTLSKSFEGIKTIGKNLIEGLWNGIKDAKDWLISKIKGFCNDALDGIKAFFGIESPSRVMADEVGTYMAKGIGVGFSKTMPSVIDAMQEKLAGITSAFQTELNFADIPQIQGNQIVSENQYITRNYTNTIETIRQPQTVELVMDGTRVARTLIPSLNSEYNRLGVKI